MRVDGQVIGALVRSVTNIISNTEHVRASIKVNLAYDLKLLMFLPNLAKFLSTT